jgi:hypothetical protein
MSTLWLEVRREEGGGRALLPKQKKANCDIKPTFTNSQLTAEISK